MVYRCFRNFIEVLEQVGELKLVARTFGIAAAALLFTGCGTPRTRISQRPEVYPRLSTRDQALVTKPLLATAGRSITGHSTGHTSRQSSPTRPKESLSPTAELFTSAICRRRRHRLVKQFRSHSVAKRMSLAARFRDGLPLIPQFPRRP